LKLVRPQWPERSGIGVEFCAAGADVEVQPVLDRLGIRDGMEPDARPVALRVADPVRPVDQILLVHTARSRAGLAAGALLAAHWIAGRRGMYAFADVLDDILAHEAEKERKVR